MKVRASSPFVLELIRGALLLGKFDLELDWSGWEAEVNKDTIKDALERARNLIRARGEKLKLLTTNNDVRSPLAKLSSECFGTKTPDTVDELLDLALKTLDRLEGCGEEYASKLAIMKAEYYENTKTPMMLSENEVVADALTFALAHAGMAWNLGNVRFGPTDFRMFFLIPIVLNEDAMNFLQEVSSAREAKGSKAKKRLLPSYVTYDWALALWMAINFDVKGVFRVIYVERGKNRINVNPSMTIDLTAERGAIERVFDRKLDEVKETLNDVLSNVLSDTPDQLAVRFVNALYQVAHNAMPAVELKNFGLREYASLLTSGSEIPYVLRQIGKVARFVKA